MIDAPQWMTPDDLAARSGIPVETIRHHCRAGHIPGAQRVGRSWMIPAPAGRLWADAYQRYGSLRRETGPVPHTGPAHPPGPPQR